MARDVPFLQVEWLLSWWKNLGNGSLFVLAVFDGDVLVGIAPWYIEESAVRGNVIRFLGSGVACSDYLSIACPDEVRGQVTATLADYLDKVNQDADSPEERWDSLLLEGIQSSDPTIQEFSRHLSDREMTVHVMPNVNCWRIELPKTWDDYLQTLSKSHRKQMRQAERRFLLSGKVQLKTLAIPQGFEPILHKLVELNEKRRDGLGEIGCFVTPEFQRFAFDVTQ